jgi:hypothetical protein
MNKRLSLAIGVPLVIATILGPCWIFASEWPGGMRPSYHATDHDLRLTYAARGARPVVEALDRYRRDHGAFPAEAGALAPYLGATGPKVSHAEMHGFDYDGGGDRYVLSKKLGWDPTLRYEFEGGRGAWVFDPGDGSNATVIALSPW